MAEQNCRTGAGGKKGAMYASKGKARHKEGWMGRLQFLQILAQGQIRYNVMVML
jgi:hypothetical protein